MNKNILIAILIVIIIALGAAFALGQFNGKTNTQIDIKNNETFQNGEQVQFQLKDAQGNALSGKTVEINFNKEKYSVTTDQNGKGYLSIIGMASGKYDLEVSYAGDDTYNGCDSKATITVDAESVADNPAKQTANTATTTTGNTSKNSNNNNNKSDHVPGDHPGCTFVGDYLCWVNEYGVIVDARDPDAIGMTLNDYIKLYWERVHGDDDNNNDNNGSDTG